MDSGVGKVTFCFVPTSVTCLLFFTSLTSLGGLLPATAKYGKRAVTYLTCFDFTSSRRFGMHTANWPSLCCTLQCAYICPKRERERESKRERDEVICNHWGMVNKILCTGLSRSFLREDVRKSSRCAVHSCPV